MAVNKSISVFLFPLLLSSVYLTSLVESVNNGGITLDLIHRDSRLSPSYDPSNTRFERLKKAFDRSFSRKSSLSLRSSSRTQDIEAPISASGDIGEYLMTIHIGTPPVKQLAIADTGSDLTWIQCEPCTQCYNQNVPLFDPSKTKSYRRVSCKSDQCVAAGKDGNSDCDSDNGCQYNIYYGDFSRTSGDVATETFTFGSPTSQGNVSFSKVVFGCGHQNAGTFSANASGIVGLAGGSVSIINQLKSTIGGKFSYCLTLTDSKVPSKISFGSNAIVTGPNVLSTPIVTKSPDTFYYLTLEGLSVGTERLDYKSNIKASSDEGNIVLDSGTTLTFIPSMLYKELESTLVKAIKGTRESDPEGLFKLCYKLPSDGKLSSPQITAHFKGADVMLPKENTFVEMEKGLVCLTLLPTFDTPIFGNLNQMNYHIGYDLVKHEVNFLPTDCEKSK